MGYNNAAEPEPLCGDSSRERRSCRPPGRPWQSESESAVFDRTSFATATFANRNTVRTCIDPFPPLDHIANQPLDQYKSTR